MSKNLREPFVTLTMLEWSESSKVQYIVISETEQPSTEVRVLAAKQNWDGIQGWTCE